MVFKNDDHLSGIVFLCGFNFIFIPEKFIVLMLGPVITQIKHLQCEAFRLREYGCTVMRY